MRSSLGERAWDVLIIDATGEPADCSLRLRDALLGHDLRVQLDIVPAPSAGDLPPLTGARASQAAYCVILMTTEHGTSYVAIPAPRFPGQAPKVGPGDIETGPVRDDLAGLAVRIAGRLRRQ